MNAVLDAEAQVVHHRVGVGEVDHGLRAGRDQVGQVVPGVDPRDQVEVRGVLDGPAHLAPDPAVRSEHSDLQHHAHSSSSGPTIASVSGWANNSLASTCTSSTVTASTRRITSSMPGSSS